MHMCSLKTNIQCSWIKYVKNQCFDDSKDRKSDESTKLWIKNDHRLLFLFMQNCFFCHTNRRKEGANLLWWLFGILALYFWVWHRLWYYLALGSCHGAKLIWQRRLRFGGIHHISKSFISFYDTVSVRIKEQHFSSLLFN